MLTARSEIRHREDTLSRGSVQMSVMAGRSRSRSHAHGRSAERENRVVGRTRRFDNDIAPRFADFHLLDASKHAPRYQDSRSAHDSFHGRLPKMDRMFGSVGRHAKNGNPHCPRRVVRFGFSRCDRGVIAGSGRPGIGWGVRIPMRRRLSERSKAKIGFPLERARRQRQAARKHRQHFNGKNAGVLYKLVLSARMIE